jgi:hypothetical protein
MSGAHALSSQFKLPPESFFAFSDLVRYTKSFRVQQARFMDTWSLITGGASLLSLLIALYELRRKNSGSFMFFLGIFVVFAFFVLRNEVHVFTQTPQSAKVTPYVSPTHEVPDSGLTGDREAADFREIIMASDAYALDPDLVDVVVHAHRKDASAPDVAHHLRGLLERYNFDLVKALGAYDVGPARVDECNCVPPDAHQYVAGIVKEFNKRKTIDLEIVAASAAYRLDSDLLNIVIYMDRRSASPPTVAQHLRELLERYNFDLIKALGAYDVGPERVDECNCVPPDARQYVADIVKEFNKKVRSRTSVPAPSRHASGATFE